MPADRAYLDHNATSPLRPEARAAMMEAMELVGNPSSVHSEGRAAKALMDRARRQVASLVGAKPDQVVFTSGGTEALSTIIAAHGGLLTVSALEHSALMEPARARGAHVAPASADGRVSPNAYDQNAGETSLCALQLANNETGVEQDVCGLADGASETLTDAVQVAGKRPIAVTMLGVDHLVISAHKLGGPKGVGVLVSKVPSTDRPLLLGGGQEKGARAGTENLVGIAGFGAAAEAAERDLEAFAELGAWRDEIECAVVTQTPDAVVIAQASSRLPNTSCIALPGVAAETLVMSLDLEGVAVSAGSACSSGKVTRSHVLEAMGLDDAITGSAIRVSLGWNSSKKDVDQFIRAWASVTDRLER
ncbi:MAG: cysteine desulfurase family protein [Pseudomonadota bacterium]